MTYTNALENFYSSCPGPVQEVLNFQGAYDKINEGLHWITGDPQALANRGVEYATLGGQVKQLGTAFTETGQQISGWEGDAHDAFLAKVTEYGTKIGELGDAVTSTQELLNSAAQACVDCANTIIDIVKMAIEFLIGSLVIAAATAVISFGASVAAWVAGNLANGLRVLAQVSRLTTKVAQFLTKLANILVKVSKVLKRIAELLMKLAKFIKNTSLFKGSPVADIARATLAKMAVSKVVNPLIPGADLPAGGGEAMDAAGNAHSAAGNTSDAENAGTTAPTF